MKTTTIALLALIVAMGLIVSVNAHFEEKEENEFGHFTMHSGGGCHMMQEHSEIDNKELDEMYEHHTQMHGFIEREKWNEFHNIK